MKAADIVKALGGRNGLARCPSHDDRTPSLSISDGEGGGILVHCHAGCSQAAVIDALRQLGLWPEGGKLTPMTEAERERRRQQEAERERQRNRRDAFIEGLWQKTWAEAMRGRDSPIERWLDVRLGTKLARNLDPDQLPLRWASHCTRGSDRAPAMVALMTDPVTGEPCGLHRTFLLPDGSGKSPIEPVRMMLGRAGVIRLTPDDEIVECLGVCEGIESGLAIMAFGYRPMWACGSLGGLTDFPVLAGVDCITVFSDPKPHEKEGARSCAKRWAEAGRRSFLRTPYKGDWNDALREDA